MQKILDLARDRYRSIVPATIRDPLGLARRYALDALRRAITRPALPSRRLLRQIQLTPFLDEYLAVGRAAAQTIGETLSAHGVAAGDHVLDFGCGSGRVLRHLIDRGWRLSGCDIDGDAIAWCQRHLPGTFKRNGELPPLPWDDASFSAVYTVSVFTHLSPDLQKTWAVELGRVMRSGSILVVSALGSVALDAFPEVGTPQNRATFERDGSLFVPGRGAFNQNAAVHTADALRETFGSSFDLVEHRPRGLDGFQDLAVFRRRDSSK